MKALILDEPGKLESLKVVYDREKPVPKDNEIRVRVHAVGLNPSDYQTASYSGLNDERKRVLGLEVAGVVDEVGVNVKNFKVGDRVYYLRSILNLDGGFAEYACTTAHTASKLPDEISYEVAAISPAAGFTAYQTIFQKLKPNMNKSILIHGGAGGVGGYSIQLAKLLGLRVYTTCSGRDIEYVKSLGADVAIDFKTQDVYKEISRLTNERGIDYIVNTIGPESATKDFDILAFNGQIAVTAGFPDFSKINFYDKGISIHEIALGVPLTIDDYEAQCEIAKIGDEFARLLLKGEVRPPKMTVISMEEILEYLVKMKEGKITGKVVAKIISN